MKIHSAIPGQSHGTRACTPIAPHRSPLRILAALLLISGAPGLPGSTRTAFARQVAVHTPIQGQVREAPPPTTEAPKPLLLATAAESVDALRQRQIVSPSWLNRAEELLVTAQALEPTEPRWIFGRALAARARGRLMEARGLMERTAELAPDDAEVRAWLGTSILESIGAVSRGVFDKAEQADLGVEAYRLALKLDPGQIDAHIGLAQYYLRAPGLLGGSIRKARECAAQLLKLDATNPSGSGVSYAHIVLGQIAAYQGQDAEMTRQFDLAVQAVGPAHLQLIALNAWGWSLIQDRKDFAGAEARFRRCIELAPETSAYWFGLGESLKGQGRYAEAATAYSRAIELCPDAAASSFGLAECLEKQGRPAEAGTQYAQFALRFADDPRAERARRAAKRLQR